MFYPSRKLRNNKTMLIRVGITVCLLTCSVLCGPVKNDPTPTFLLDHNIKPETYDISLEVDEDFDIIKGEVIIITKIDKDWDAEEEKYIYLHKAESIVVTKLEVKSNGEDINDEGEDSPNEIFKIPIKDGIEIAAEEEIEIFIKYTVDLKKATGLHKISYEADENGVFYTHFQPTYARTVFPCFDEPKFQAKFKLTFKNLPEDYKVLSNTDEEPGSDAEIKFKETPKMSTYMLAFVVYHEGTFDKIAGSPSEEAITFNTWGRQSQIEGTVNFGKEYGSKLVEEMEKYTNIAYDGTPKTPEPRLENVANKLDQVAIPGYLNEPMETFGLATYDESTVLLKDAGHKKAAKEQAIKTIAYGVAHHWFGDLVTSEWWGSAWLNEGFSTFFDYYLTEKAIPGEDWRMDDRLVVEEQMRALEADAYVNTPPLSAEPASNDDILARFGVIASSKGASVLRMFQNVVGDEFQVAVQNYLEDNLEDGLAKQDTLFEKLATDDIPKEYFKDWAEKKGFPLITVMKGEEKNEDDETVKGIKLTQNRYLLDGTGETSDDITYNLHLNFLTNAKEESALRTPINLKENEMFVDEEIDTDTWILIKTDGYFRVNYEDSNWMLLAKYLSQHLAETPENGKAAKSDGEIPPLERAVLVDNALHLAKEGHLEYKYALYLASFLEEEEDYIPWEAAIQNLDFLHRMVAKPTATRNESFTIDTFIAKITNKVYEKLSKLTTFSHIQKLHYSKIQHLACRAAHEGCLNTTEAKFDEWSESEQDEDLRSSVYCYGVRNNSENWDKLWEKLTGKEESEESGSSAEPDVIKQSRTEITEDERSDIIFALGCSIIPATLTKYVEETIVNTDPTISEEYIPSVLSSVYRNVDGIDVVLKFLEDKIVELEKRIDADGISIIIQDLAKYLNTDEHISSLQTIKEKSEAGEDIFNEALKEVEKNKQWLKKYGENVTEAIDCVFSDCENDISTLGGPWSARPAMLLILASFFAGLILF